MKEWFLEKTGVSEEEYDELILSDAEVVTTDTKTWKDMIIESILDFTIEKPTLMRQLLFQVKKKDGKYYLAEIPFELFYDYYHDEKLFSTIRYKECHKKSHAIAYNSDRFDVVTAKCSNYMTDNKEYLHTFLYDSKTDQVFDYTLNLVMGKDTYYELFNVRVVKILKNADLKRISSLIRLHPEFAKFIDIKEYFCFPEATEEAVKRLIK